MSERAPETAVQGRLLCGGCGIILAREGAACPCGAPSATSIAAPATGGSCWVRLTCTFTCRICGLPAPLEHLDMDGIVYCPSCGNEQAFAVEAWAEALQHAHAVGDLAGPQPDLPGGNPFASLGAKQVFADDAGRVLRVRASPGHPLCRLCAEPLGSKIEGKLLSACCPACGGKAVYERPPAADTVEPRLLGVIADGNRSGALDVHDSASPSGGAVALTCPACAAELPAPGEQQMVTCPFCGVTSRVPPHVWRRLRPAKAEPQPFWLLFANPSLRRGALVWDAERRRWEEEEAAVIEANRVERARRAPGEARRAQLILGGILLAFLSQFIIWPLYCQHRSEHRGPAEPSYAGNYRCGCKVGTRVVTHLKFWPESSRQAAFVLELLFDDSLKYPLVPLQLGESTVPSSSISTSKSLPAFGVACSDDAFIIIGGRRATAWSLENGHPRWTVELPAAMARDKDSCLELDPQDGVLSIPLEDHEPARLDLAGGELR